MPLKFPHITEPPTCLATETDTYIQVGALLTMSRSPVFYQTPVVTAAAQLSVEERAIDGVLEESDMVL